MAIQVSVSPFALTSKIPFESERKPFVKTQKLAYIDEFILDCRLTGIYKTLKKGDYERTKSLIRDTLNIMMTAGEIDMTKIMYRKIVDELYHMIVELAFKKFNSVHDRIRNLHYYIVCSYKWL